MKLHFPILITWHFNLNKDDVDEITNKLESCHLLDKHRTKTLAATCVYSTAMKHGIPVDIKQISNTRRVTESTIRRLVRNLTIDGRVKN